MNEEQKFDLFFICKYDLPISKQHILTYIKELLENADEKSIESSFYYSIISKKLFLTEIIYEYLPSKKYIHHSNDFFFRVGCYTNNIDLLKWLHNVSSFDMNISTRCMNILIDRRYFETATWLFWNKNGWNEQILQKLFLTK